MLQWRSRPETAATLLVTLPELVPRGNRLLSALADAEPPRLLCLPVSSVVFQDAKAAALEPGHIPNLHVAIHIQSTLCDLGLDVLHTTQQRTLFPEKQVLFGKPKTLHPKLDHAETRSQSELPRDR